MKRFLTLLFVAIMLTGCGPTEELPGYIPAEVDIYSDGTTTDGAVWTDVTWVEVLDNATNVVFYQATISGASVHFIFDPQAGTDYFLESDITLVVNAPYEMYDPNGQLWGTLTLETDGSVTWTAPAGGEYVPDEPMTPAVPQGAG